MVGKKWTEKQHLHQRRLADGLCAYCGEEPHEPGKKGCSGCLRVRREWSQSNRDRWRAQNTCILCGKRPALPGSSRCDECRETQNDAAQARQRRQRKALRDAIIARYGGACACCGEDEPLFLEVDHVHDDGAAERRLLGGKSSYAWIRDHDFPPDYQLLCANCNRGKYRNGGVCPHRKRSEDGRAGSAAVGIKKEDSSRESDGVLIRWEGYANVRETEYESADQAANRVGMSREVLKKRLRHEPELRHRLGARKLPHAAGGEAWFVRRGVQIEPRGGGRPSAKGGRVLSREEREQAGSRAAEGEDAKDLATEYGVDRSHVYRLRADFENATAGEVL